MESGSGDNSNIQQESHNMEINQRPNDDIVHGLESNLDEADFEPAEDASDILGYFKGKI